MIVRAFKMGDKATDEECRALSDKLEYHGKLMCDNAIWREIVVQFDDELDLLAFLIAIDGAKMTIVAGPELFECD